jgi:hypothetical protein
VRRGMHGISSDMGPLLYFWRCALWLLHLP